MLLRRLAPALLFVALAARAQPPPPALPPPPSPPHPLGGFWSLTAVEAAGPSSSGLAGFRLVVAHGRAEFVRVDTSGGAWRASRGDIEAPSLTRSLGSGATAWHEETILLRPTDAAPDTARWTFRDTDPREVSIAFGDGTRLAFALDGALAPDVAGVWVRTEGAESSTFPGALELDARSLALRGATAADLPTTTRGLLPTRSDALTADRFLVLRFDTGDAAETQTLAYETGPNRLTLRTPDATATYRRPRSFTTRDPRLVGTWGIADTLDITEDVIRSMIGPSPSDAMAARASDFRDRVRIWMASVSLTFDADGRVGIGRSLTTQDRTTSGAHELDPVVVHEVGYRTREGILYLGDGDPSDRQRVAAMRYRLVDEGLEIRGFLDLSGLTVRLERMP